jgi:hypothetical protein
MIWKHENHKVLKTSLPRSYKAVHCLLMLELESIEVERSRKNHRRLNAYTTTVDRLAGGPAGPILIPARCLPYPRVFRESCAANRELLAPLTKKRQPLTGATLENKTA